MSDDFDKDLERLEEIRATVRLAASTSDMVFLLSFIDKLWNEYTRTLQQLDDSDLEPPSPEHPCGCMTNTAGREICEERSGPPGTYCRHERRLESEAHEHEPVPRDESEIL